CPDRLFDRRTESDWWSPARSKEAPDIEFEAVEETPSLAADDRHRQRGGHQRGRHPDMPGWATEREAQAVDQFVDRRRRSVGDVIDRSDARRCGGRDGFRSPVVAQGEKEQGIDEVLDVDK